MYSGGTPINFSIKYGLEYNVESHHGFKINLKTMFNQHWLHGTEIDNVRAAQYATSASPVDNRLASYQHNSTYFKSELEVSQKVSKPHKGPTYLGVGVSGNIPVSDVIQTDGTFGCLNMAPYNNELVKVKLFVHF